ncbi:GAF domain-containing protein [Rhodobacterales bacterium HKCCE2091]|nr:GAF domain-containing protein [Rhodobacterales bacterium HKCCE2091]
MARGLRRAGRGAGEHAPRGPHRRGRPDRLRTIPPRRGERENDRPRGRDRSAVTSTTTSVDLTNCDREPIHRLGRVQSYGALVAVGPDWRVAHASENLGTVLGVDAADAVGAPLSAIIRDDALARIRRYMGAVESSDNAVRVFGVELRDGGGAFDISIHQGGRLLIIEFEPKGRSVETDLLSEVHPLIRRIRFKEDLATLASDAARGLRYLSRFDSVMVYRFERDGSGQVIAESRADGERRYMDQRFPASDIPKQARALYKRSLLRLIADVGDPGAAILPGTGPDGQPIDLSLAVTRAVSPIHIEYLGNMGVGASMSVSIMKDGELWGLFACHHDSPHYIDYERRTAVEMFGHLFSYELGRYEESLRRKAQDATSALQTRLVERFGDARPAAAQLLALTSEIAQVIPHDGAAVILGGKAHSQGDVPDEAALASLVEAISEAVPKEIMAIECLADFHPPARAYSKGCAGALVIPVSALEHDYLIFFRREIEVVMNWAGDPSKPVQVGPNGIRLTPRASFELWQETVAGHSAPWDDYTMVAAERLRQIMLEVVLKVAEAGNAARARAAEQQQLLISELNHRVRNILNLMRGLVAQSKAGARSVTEFTESLDGRIHSLSRAHDQLTRENYEPASLKFLIRTEFEAYADAKAERVEIDGPDAMIAPAAYSTLALVLHEMATNSIKYGALSDRAGRVEVSLAFDGTGALTVGWIERGGPAVRPPSRRGFGTAIVERSIPHELNGAAEIHYRVTGVEAEFRIPARHATRATDAVSDTAPESEARTAPAAARPGVALSGNGLVLEDSLIIAMDAADILQGLGANRVDISASVEEALSRIDTAPPDFALLDVNLGSEQSVPVAEKLAALGIPFVLATGYGETGSLADVYPPCVIVQKPFSNETLASGFAEALASGNSLPEG